MFYKKEETTAFIGGLAALAIYFVLGLKYGAGLGFIVGSNLIWFFLPVPIGPEIMFKAALAIAILSMITVTGLALASIGVRAGHLAGKHILRKNGSNN